VATSWVLAVDLGTSGLKVGSVSEDGVLLSVFHADLTTTFTDDGGVEQDTDSWWVGVRAGVAHALAAGADPAALVAVAITGQYGSTVPVGPRGDAVGPCLIWADDRGARWARAAVGGPAAGYRPSVVAPWIRHTGGLPSPNGADPSGHALYLRYGRPELHARVALLLEPVDFLGLRFTGVAAATPASAVGSWLTDNRPGAPLEYVPKLVRLARRDPAKLPPLRPSGSVLGGIAADASAELGLPEGVPVLGGVPDLHAAYVGSGAVEDYQAHVAISTTSWVSCAVPFKKTDVFHQIASVPGVRPGQYLMINNHETAGACLQWVRDGVLRTPGGHGSDWQPSYDDLVALAAESPPGAGGVVFTPWLKGERSPVDDRNLRAAFLNVSLDTDQADLVRAVLEGVAYNLRWLLEAADSFAKQRLDPLRVLGGGAQSDLWCQIHSDVTGRRVERIGSPGHAQLRGVALLALVGLGRLTLPETAERVPLDTVFEPEPAAQATYEPLYRAFASAYGRLKGWYRSLNG
jgi:xylulokinase